MDWNKWKIKIPMLTRKVIAGNLTTALNNKSVRTFLGPRTLVLCLPDIITANLKVLYAPYGSTNLQGVTKLGHRYFCHVNSNITTRF